MRTHVVASTEHDTPSGQLCKLLLSTADPVHDPLSCLLTLLCDLGVLPLRLLKKIRRLHSCCTEEWMHRSSLSTLTNLVAGTGLLNGRSEELLGQFVRELPGSEKQRDSICIATKLAPYPWRITSGVPKCLLTC